MLRALLLALLFIAAPAVAQTPQAVLDELLAADRAFAAQAATLDPVAGITAMLDDEAVMPLPGKGILSGKAAVAEAFRASPAFKDGHVTWAPVRGGISADGTQGFTYGFLTVGSGDDADGEPLRPPWKPGRGATTKKGNPRRGRSSSGRMPT